MGVSVVGAGPVGSYLAWKLSKKGVVADVFERKCFVGLPVQCTGILTRNVRDHLQLRRCFLRNTVRSVTLHSPSGGESVVPVLEYVVCRKSFDNFLLQRALDGGVGVRLGCELKEVDGESFVVGGRGGLEKFSLKDNVLVGADGPNSMVSRFLNPGVKRGFYVGAQAVVRMECDSSNYDVYFNEKIGRYFGWAVPESDGLVRVGVAAKSNVSSYFGEFLKVFAADKGFSLEKLKRRTVEIQGGLIPEFDHRLVVGGGNVFTVGDAAGQVKNTTGGGLVSGFKSADCLVKSLTAGGSYSSLLSKVNRELWVHAKLKEIVDGYSDGDWDELIRVVGSKEVKNVLGSESRDSPVSLLLKLFLAKPSIAKFAFK